MPVLLLRLVGNPWPGWERIELGDERALVVGVLASLAWLLWARFVLAVVMAVPDQLAELRDERDRPPDAPVRVAAPPHPRAGVGLVAARLVAAALVLLPLGARAVPAAGAPPLPAVAAVSASTAAVPARPATAPVASSAVGAIAVADGDTLVGLARRHLGDGDRWREIFELNRDRPQRDGAALTRPSALQAGWTLVLPADASTVADPPPPTGPATVTVAEGDTLWDLAHDRLADAGLAHDDASTAEYVAQVVAANVDVVEDPNLIYPGEQVELPAVGEAPVPATVAPPTVAPPPPPVVAAPAPVAPAPAPAPAAVHDLAVPVPDVSAAPTTVAAVAPTTPSSEPPAAPTDGDHVAATRRASRHRSRSAWAKRPSCPPACSRSSPLVGARACGPPRRGCVCPSPRRSRSRSSGRCVRSTPASGCCGWTSRSGPPRPRCSTRPPGQRSSGWGRTG